MKKIEIPKFLEPEILKKIRYYFIYYLLVFFLLWILFFIYSPQLINFIIFPYLKLFKENSLIFTSIEEAFYVLLRLSFYITIIVTTPFLIIPLAWWFSKNFKEKKGFLKKFLLLSFLNLIVGLLVGYFLIFPNFLKFFLFFGQQFEPWIKIDFFVFFFLKVIFFSILILEFPLFLIILIKTNLLKKDFYQKKKIYFWGLFYALAVLISPTDFFVQALLILTFYLFFKLSFELAKFF